MPQDFLKDYPNLFVLIIPGDSLQDKSIDEYVEEVLSTVADSRYYHVLSPDRNPMYAEALEKMKKRLRNKGDRTKMDLVNGALTFSNSRLGTKTVYYLRLVEILNRPGIPNWELILYGGAL